jgi:cysteinyl-tRNA synthetase
LSGQRLAYWMDWLSGMKIHNTLTKKTEEFKPLKPGQASLYTCGPTVYSYYHVGNLRNAVFNDTLRRTLEAANYQVKHVLNITDVGHLTSDADEGEDKLEKGAKSDGKTVWEVANFYTEAFKQDTAELNILPPNGYHGPSGSYARATDFIDQQIEMVKILLQKGFAYHTQQAIYFDVTKLSDYGRLTGQKLADKEVGARADVVTDQQKHHPQDFALWFFAAGHFEGHSMRWPIPWGEGFPGWHLECSAIIHATLGDPIDIHTGAVDLIGTHHTNEIAQTEAAFGNQLANYWVHNEYMLINGEKMSKSLNNIYTLADVRRRGYDPLALRLLFLQSHYRSQANFTWEALDAAASFLKRLQAWADLRYQTSADAMTDELDNLFRVTRQTMIEKVTDDLDTAGALAALSKLVSYMHVIPIPGVEGQHTDGTLKLIDDLFGLDLNQRADISDEQKRLIREREAARHNNEWAKADELRQKLQDQSLEINDTDHGPVWSRI